MLRMRAGAIFLQHEALVAAAAVAAQAVGLDAGFRQRDVRFFVELFSNWLQSTTGKFSLAVHNAQVQRQLDVLVSARWAKRTGRTPPRYLLTPEGLVELLGRMVLRQDLTRLDEFFLVYHILDAYGSRLHDMLGQSGPLTSRTLAAHVRELLDPRAFVERERRRVQSELNRLAQRIDESLKTSELTRRLLARGEPLDQVIAEVQRRYPYELNSQKPLDELLHALPAPWRRAELEQAAERRASSLWGPTREMLVAYDRVLASLLPNVRSESGSGSGGSGGADGGKP